MFFASERTLLAGVRTGLAIIGLGSVVARFGGLVLRIMAREAGQTAAISRNPVSRLIGVAFVVIGAVSMVPASVHHRTFVKGLPLRDLPANYFLGFSLWVSIATSLRGTCPAPDRIVHLPIGAAVGAARSATLMKSAGLELIWLVIPAGKEIPPHRAPGEITLQCIEGHVAFEHDGHAIDLHAGDLLHLCPQESHALKGIADSSVLVTRLRLHADELPEKFPAE